MKFAIISILPFLNNPKDLDPSCKMDLDFWDCFGRKKLHLITKEIRYLSHKVDFYFCFYNIVSIKKHCEYKENSEILSFCKDCFSFMLEPPHEKKMLYTCVKK